MILNALRTLAVIFGAAALSPANALAEPPGSELCRLMSARLEPEVAARLADSDEWAYRAQVGEAYETALAEDHTTDELSARLAVIQTEWTQRMGEMPGLGEFDRSLACRAITATGGEAMASLDDTTFVPAEGMDAYRERGMAVVKAQRAEMDDVLSRTRFRTPLARKAFMSGYLCFIANVVLDFTPKDNRERMIAASFGENERCADLAED